MAAGAAGEEYVVADVSQYANRGIIMRAIAISEFGAVPELMDLPAPTPAPGEVLVKMHAAGFNPFDLKVADGALKDAVEHRFPLVLGVDGAGVVESIGPGVTRFRPGERVYGQFLNPAAGLGSYAEYALAAQDGPIARMPEGMIFEQAAAVPTASMTAYNMVETARVDSGTKVLIVGATGGVGQSATQLAAGRGGHVIATAAADAADLMRALGAAETVDHTTAGVGEQVLAAHPEGIDAIIDLVSPPNAIEPLAGLVRPGGTFVSSQFALDTDALAAREIRAVNFDNVAGPELLMTLADLVDGSRLKVRVESQVSMAQAPAMLAGAGQGRARGKTVIRI